MFSLYFFFCFQGANASALEKEIGPEQFPVNEHYFGLVNVSVSGVTLYRQKHHHPHALSLLFFHSSATLATVTRCCRLCTSVDRSGRRCWRTRWVTRENYSDCVQELDCRVCEWATDERRISCTWKIFEAAEMLNFQPSPRTPEKRLQLLALTDFSINVTLSMSRVSYRRHRLNKTWPHLHFTALHSSEHEPLGFFQVQPRRKESLLTCLADLFNSIATQKKKVGVIPPKKFISRLRKENGEFVNRARQILKKVSDLVTSRVAKGWKV